MAAATAGDGRLDQALSCAVCMERFDLDARAPKLLPCFHTYCLACLTQLRPARCPLGCSGEFLLKGLASNFALVDVLEASVPHDEAPQPPQNCSFCDNKPATVHCVDCEGEEFCDACFAGHTRTRAGKGHTSVKFGQPLPLSKLMCSEHPSQELKYLCENDKKLFCMECFPVYHSGHRVVGIQQALQQDQGDTLDAAVATTRKLLQEYTAGITLVKAELEAVATQETDVLAGINAYFDALAGALEQRRQELLSTDLFATRRKTLDNQHDQLSVASVQLQTALDQIDALRRKEDEPRTLQALLRTSELVQEMRNRRLDLEPSATANVKFDEHDNVLHTVESAGRLREEKKTHYQYGRGRYNNGWD